MNDSAVLGMQLARTGVEMLHVQKGTHDDSNCHPTWVPSDLNLADSLTKANKTWVVRFNHEFVSA